MKGAVLALGVVLVTWVAPAHAQVEVQASVSSQTVEVGQEFQLQISAQGGADSPENPRLVAPPSFVVRGPSVSTQVQMSLGLGGRSITRGLNATWTLAAQRTGKFVLGPASVTLDGNQYQSKPVSVEVVPQGSLPQQPQRARRSPFGGGIFDPFGNDPFSNFPGFPNFNDMLQEEEPSLPEYPQELVIPAALDPIAFVRATVDPVRVYVGQQVTLRVYAYGGRGPYNQASAREPAHVDFFARPILDESGRISLYRVPLGKQIWFAAKIRETALYPLRAGQLQIGSMEFGFGGGRYPATPPDDALLRRSQPLNVEVVEPPLADRPPGYQIGDVGSFELHAEVSPRQVEAGGAVSVVVTLTGSGNLPHSLKTPEGKGIDFLTPATSEKIELQNGKYGGSKTFSYVVRLNEPGTIDLGEIKLPYFDPDDQRYHVAAAKLGTIAVKPGATVSGAPPPAAGPSGLAQLAQTLKPRDTLGPEPRHPAYLADKKGFWLALLLGPLGALSLFAFSRSASRLRLWLSARRHSSGAQLQADLKAAETAARAHKLSDAVSAVERALYRAIETATALRARGILRQDLASALGEQGLAPETCQEVVTCLEQCDFVRFSTQDPEQALLLTERARRLTKELGAARKPRRPSPLNTPSPSGGIAG